MKKIAVIAIYACIAFIAAFFSIHFLSFFPLGAEGVGMAYPLIVSLWLRPALPLKSFVLFALGTAGLYDALALHTFPITLIAMSVTCIILHAFPFVDPQPHLTRTPQLLNLFLLALTSIVTYSAVVAILNALTRYGFFTPGLIAPLTLSIIVQTLLAFGGSAIAGAVQARMTRPPAHQKLSRSSHL